MRFRRVRAEVVTDAPLSPAEEQRHRERVYAALMVVHLVGLLVGGLLYLRAWEVGLALIIITGPLPWVAVVLANDSSRRWGRRRRRDPGEVSPPPRTGTGGT
ncbi:DUF3099 domain-containing protein [Pseudonocardia bannensis]|uniref:DUF3099 domain-containing protein n=1 Tax=Pseudonocardia bannensis TaxID=630973 RepID=A0A848DGI1_9PSEU|nr:DUF3099 domain-containing protein [Pseudonocardia bannensis]NMH91665.1 DUF3099 domain-containing protein [Pseudonocardia bannensis]